MQFSWNDYYGPPSADGWDVFVFAGQSNECEVGLGPYTDTSSTNDGLIWQVGRTGTDNFKIIPATRPLAYWNGGTGLGSGLSRARYYISRGHLASGRKVLIVPAAHGGTSILEWDGTMAGDGLHLYEDMVARTNVGLALPNASVKMFVWRQIEADMVASKSHNNPYHTFMPDFATFQTHTLDFIDRIRTVFGSTVPVVYTHPTPDYVATQVEYSTFDTGLDTIAAARTRCCATITTGLTSNFSITGDTIDKVHFSAAAQETIALQNIIDFEGL